MFYIICFVFLELNYTLTLNALLLLPSTSPGCWYCWMEGHSLTLPLPPQQLEGRFVNKFPINPYVPSMKAIWGEQWSTSLSSFYWMSGCEGSSPTVEKEKCTAFKCKLKSQCSKEQDHHQYRNKSKYLENMIWFFPS